MKKTNKEKFQELDRKKKAEYIWDYYRWHIIGTIAGIFMIFYVIHFVNRPKPPVYSADLVVAGMIKVDEEVLDESRLKMQEAIDGGVATIPTDWKVIDPVTMANQQLLMLKMQTKECDLLATPEAKFNDFMNVEAFDAFYPLETIEALQPTLEKYKDQLIIDESVSDEEEHVYGIRLKELKNIEGIMLGEELILSMVRPPKDVDAAVDLINYVLDVE